MFNNIWADSVISKTWLSLITVQVVLGLLYFLDWDLCCSLLCPAPCHQEADLCGLHLFGSLALWFLVGFSQWGSPAKGQEEEEKDRDFLPCQVIVWQWQHSSIKCHRSSWVDVCSLRLLFLLRQRGPRDGSSTLPLLAHRDFTVLPWFPSTLPSPWYVFPSLNSLYSAGLNATCLLLGPCQSYDQDVQGGKEDYFIYTISYLCLLKP